MTIKALTTATSTPRLNNSSIVSAASSLPRPTVAEATPTDVFQASPSRISEKARGYLFGQDRYDVTRPAVPYIPVETNLKDPAPLPMDPLKGIYTDTEDGELWGAGGPSVNDVEQGKLADCWLMASIGSLVKSDPQRIRDMIQDNGDGTYNVRLYTETPKGSGNFQPQWETVDDDFMRWGNIKTDEMYANAGDSDHDGKQEIWVALIEKAVAQHWDKTFPSQRHGYAQLDYGSQTMGLEVLTGMQTNTRFTNSTDSDVMWGDMQRANNGGVVVAGTGADAKLMNGVWQPHSYIVMDAVEINGQRFVDLKNPAGSGEPFDGGQLSDGEFRLTWADFQKNFAYVSSQARPD